LEGDAPVFAVNPAAEVALVAADRRVVYGDRPGQAPDPAAVPGIRAQNNVALRQGRVGRVVPHNATFYGQRPLVGDPAAEVVVTEVVLDDGVLYDERPSGVDAASAGVGEISLHGAVRHRERLRIVDARSLPVRSVPGHRAVRQVHRPPVDDARTGVAHVFVRSSRERQVRERRLLVLRLQDHDGAASRLRQRRRAQYSDALFDLERRLEGDVVLSLRKADDIAVRGMKRQIAERPRRGIRRVVGGIDNLQDRRGAVGSRIPKGAGRPGKKRRHQCEQQQQHKKNMGFRLSHSSLSPFRI